jgi:hypothetical protein
MSSYHLYVCAIESTDIVQQSLFSNVSYSDVDFYARILVGNPQVPQYSKWVKLANCYVGFQQVGMPADREQYIHRVGRTGRAGKGGKASLLLAEHESFFLKDVSDLPVRLRKHIEPASLSFAQTAVANALRRVSSASKDGVCTFCGCAKD